MRDFARRHFQLVATLLSVSTVAFVMLFTNALPTWPTWGRVAFALAIWVNADPLIARLLLDAIDDDWGGKRMPSVSLRALREAKLRRERRASALAPQSGRQPVLRPVRISER